MCLDPGPVFLICIQEIFRPKKSLYLLPFRSSLNCYPLMVLFFPLPPTVVEVIFRKSTCDDGGELETAELFFSCAFSFHPDSVNERGKIKNDENFFSVGSPGGWRERAEEKMRRGRMKYKKLGAFYVEFIFHAWVARDFSRFSFPLFAFRSLLKRGEGEGGWWWRGISAHCFCPKLLLLCLDLFFFSKKKIYTFNFFIT